MSGKGKGVDQNVKERRLRPIYEFLDIGNHKRVLQEVDRLLKKQPDFQCAKAIKALALLRMGHEGECRAILDPLVKEMPTDDGTIQALTICYRELGEPKMVCIILENASKIDKTEDLLSSCFMANVRVSDFQKQYQVALNLYKVHPKVPYFAWAVMSLFAKAELDPDPSSLRISLPLAEKMMGKFIEENQVESEHELSLYALILFRLGNFEKVLGIMEQLSKQKTPVLTGFCYRLTSQCLQKTHAMDSLDCYLKASILSNLLEWGHYEDYLKNFGLSETRRAQDFLDNLLEKHLAHPPSRSILIAPLFLYRILVLNSGELFDPIPYLQKYLFHYGNSPSFFADLDIFFSCLTSRELKLKIAQVIGKDLKEIRQDFSKPNNIQAELNYCCARRYLEDEPQDASTLSMVEDFVKKYLTARGKQLTAGVEWPLKEGPHDYFINLAALYLIDKFWNFDSKWSLTCANEDKLPTKKPHENDATSTSPQITASSSNVPQLETSKIANDLTALTNGITFLQLENQKPFFPNKRDLAPILTMALLHYSLDKSPRNSQTRILLGKCYIRCGAVGAGASVLADLDIKHFMLISMNYLSMWKLISCAQHKDALRSLATTEAFYSSFEKESMEHVLSAYKYGSWEKIIEFLKFRDHLLNSLQRSMLRTEKALLELINECPSAYFENHRCKDMLKIIQKSGDLDQILHRVDALTDSRDFEIIDTFRIRDKVQEWKEVSFKAEKKRLKVRSILVALLKYLILLTEDIASNRSAENVSKIEAYLQMLNEEREGDVSKFLMDDVTVDVMWPPRTPHYVKGEPLTYLLSLFSIITDVAKDKGNIDLQVVPAELKSCVDAVLGKEKFVKFEDDTCLLDIAEILETITELVEAMSLSCIILDILSFIMKTVPSGGTQNKSRKKKSKSTEGDNSGQLSLVELIKSTSEAFNRIEAFLQTFTAVLSKNYPSSWESMASFWTTQVDRALVNDILPYSLPIVVAKLRSSYADSATAICYLIQGKQSYLKQILQATQPNPA